MIPTEPDFPNPRQKWINLTLAVLLTVMALIIRLQALDVFITADELKWVGRSINFYRGLYTGHLDQTLQKGHPGVVTMWLGVPWMNVDPMQPWLEIFRNPSVSDMIAQVSAQTPAQLGAFLFAARHGVAVLTSVAVGVAFLLLVRLFSRDVALIASTLMLFDPFYLAHSRFLHLDAIIASFLFLSVLSLLISLREEHRGFLIFSGVLSGLAMLNKSPAMISMPFAALVITWYGLARRRSFGWLLRTGLAWLVPTMLTYVLFWPAMWVQPGRTLSTVFTTALFYASRPHANSNFFWGAPRPDPGPAFYPVALAFRLTPWTTLGGLLGLPWLVRRHRQRDTLWVFGSFVLIYTAFMTLGQKKFDRYLLPVFPFVHTIATVGLLGAGDWLLSHWRVARPQQSLALASSALILILSAATVLPHAPYYLTYYNPLLGGVHAAVKTLLVGWGEGVDLAAAYLNTLPDIESKQASARALPPFAPLFNGHATHEDNYDAATTHYVVIYLNEVQRRLSPNRLERYYDSAEPLYTGQIKGIDYVWVYENRTHEPPMTYIDSHADPTSDAIVVSRPSLFAENYHGSLPLHVLQPDWREEDVLAILQTVAHRAERVWYVRYAQKNPDPRLEWIDFQWQTHVFLLEEQSYTDVDVFLWETKNGSSFVGTEQVHRDLNLRFGDALELRGYTLTEPAAQWPRDLGALFEWRPLRELDKYYSSFVHVVDDAGRLWGQGDHWMVNEALVPTVEWKQGDVVFDRSTVSLNPGIPPATYRLVMGVHDRITQHRLPVVDSAGQGQGDGYDIGTVVVVPSPWKPRPDELPIQHRREIVLTPALRLLGWSIDRTQVGFDEQLTAALFWQATAQPTGDYTARLRLVDPDGAVWAQGEFPLASAEYPTSRWEAGETLWRFCDLRVSEDAPTTDAVLTLDVLHTTGEPIAGSVDLTDLHIEGHYFEEPAITYAQPAQIGDHVRLLGFDVQPTAIRAGDTLELTLYWRADDLIASSYTVFTHLLDPTGFVRGQKDSVPLDGRYPTSQWRSDETIVDRYSIEVAPDAPAGQYQLEIGMYDSAAGAQRLPLFNADGVRQQDDRLLLDVEVRVQP